jgi:signal transduction histidine kinase/CheY-like chemotaxis protein
MTVQSKPSYQQLETLCEKLQKRVSKFSAVELNLVMAKDRIDRELARFKSIQSYSEKSIQAEDISVFGEITAESVVETFEVECGAVYLYDPDKKVMKPVGMHGFPVVDKAYPVDDRFITDIVKVNSHDTVIESPPRMALWRKTDLCQAIYSPFYNLEGRVCGIVLGGRSQVNKEFYDEINPEILSSFAVFVSQMESMYHNIESVQRDSERTRQLERLNWELFKENLERQHMERALRESENRYRSIFNSSTVSMWEEDASRLFQALQDLKSDGVTDFRAYVKTHPQFVDKAANMIRINNVNAATLALYEIEDKSDVIGTLEPFITDQTRRWFEELVIAAGTGKQRFECEMQVSTMKGRPLDVLMSVDLPHEKAHWAQILVSIIDITRRKEAEREKKKLEDHLQQAMKMEAIGTLAGGIAHDFNNILAAIMGYGEMAQLDIKPGHSGADSIEEILKASRRAKKLVMQLLTFGKPGTTQKDPIQIDLVVKEALGLMKASLPATIEIIKIFEPDLKAVKANPTQIHQLIMNLLTNSAHAMEKQKGTIRVGLANVAPESSETVAFVNLEKGPLIKLWVEDDGCGIAPDIITRIFDPYFTTKEQGKGTGIGLAQAHGIVKSHNGEICVQSKPGVGTRMDIYFPAMTPLDEKPMDVPISSTQGKGNILFVDDEKMLADIGKRMLERVGYQVTATTSPVQALEIFKYKPHRFDIVISDMTMPDMTGDTFFNEIKKIREDVPVIICTGYSSMMNEEKAQQMGVAALIMKPVSISKMTLAIQKATDSMTNSE